MLIRMLTKLTLYAIVSLLAVQHGIHAQYEAFGEADEAEYLRVFDTLIRDSYSAPLPSDLVTQCKNQAQAAPNLPTRTISTSMTSTEAQTLCGTDSICNVPGGLTLTMNS